MNFSNSSPKGSIALSAWGEIVSDKSEGTISFLHGRLAELGYNFVDIEDENANFFVSIQHNPSDYKKATRNRNFSKKVLVNHEPKVASPREYTKPVVSGYDKVFRWSPWHLQSSEEESFTAGIFWAESAAQTIHKYASRKRPARSVGMIQANKHSFVKGSLYSLRRDVMETIAASGAAPIVNLAGLNWERGIGYSIETNLRSLAQAFASRYLPQLSKFSRPIRRHSGLSLVGQVEDTLEFLSSVEIAIVIENEATYVSEKIANAILAGCVPIYCGPDLKYFNIPTDVCIQVSPQPEIFVETIAKMNEDQKAAVLEAGRDWLNSQQAAELYSYDNAMIRLANLIDSTLNPTH